MFGMTIAARAIVNVAQVMFTVIPAQCALMNCSNRKFMNLNRRKKERKTMYVGNFYCNGKMQGGVIIQFRSKQTNAFLYWKRINIGAKKHRVSLDNNISNFFIFFQLRSLLKVWDRDERKRTSDFVLSYIREMKSARDILIY